MTELSNNHAELIGTVKEALTFNHEVYGEGFYKLYLKISRLSDAFDYIPVIVSERLLVDVNLKPGDAVKITGQFRSYNNYQADQNQNNRLLLNVFAKNVAFADENDDSANPNSIYLNGFICKPPVYRITPFGREISDILIAVNRTYNKSDYIPCIAWGRNAKYCEKFVTGENIKIWGRIQSRDYQKKLPNDEIMTKTAYEVSVCKIEPQHKERILLSDEDFIDNDKK